MHSPSPKGARIWAYAFGYFACYAPYSALTKLMSQGHLPGMTRAVDGFEVLPITTFASLVGMVVFISAARWWKHAGRRRLLGLQIPAPSRWTLLSGLATAAIIATTTLAYTFDGLSIVFMMLLMRGGVLVIAPIVDLFSKRRVKDRSWIALGLSFAALVAAVADTRSFALTVIAAIDVAVYLASYFVRLRFMSKMAKSEEREDSLRYFVEEQMVATPAIFLALVVGAAIGRGEVLHALRLGFTDAWSTGTILPGIVVGLLSQGTGVFGALILLDGRENVFCVPVNRASSMLAGVLSTGALAVFAGGKPSPVMELVGAGLMLVAVLVLAVPGRKPRVPAAQGA